MCGIAGILHRSHLDNAAVNVGRMASSMRHRGPDDEGYWHDADIALGFVRLSILDLEGGHQPMCNEDESVWTVYNGEIYNHVELRRELVAAGHAFRSDHSDTEILVHGWEQWGTALPERLNGMFAFAIWDARARRLFLARDRYGIKPLYVAHTADGTTLFASEIRAIHASGLVPVAPDCNGVLEYFSQQNLYGDRTMFAGVEQFPNGTWEEFQAGERQRRVKFWDYRFPRDSRLSLEDAAATHRAILSRAVDRHIAADVPVMAYLSGGIDSSAIVSAAFQRDHSIRAYSCIFALDGVGDDRVVDERDYSRGVAAHLGINHIQLEVAQTALTQALDNTVHALEDLRMGMSYVNYLIAQRVAHDSKVVLSGTGGDELHGGYVARYQATGSLPVSGFSPAHLFRWRPWKRRTVETNGLDIYRDLLNFPVKERDLDRALTPEFRRMASSYSPRTSIDAILDACPHDHVWDKLMYVDARTYLQGLLVLEDKLSMAHSLESRIPLLDNELVDFVSRLPWAFLTDGDTGKIVFRESVRPWVPDNIYRKPKMGFGPPDASWYRGALRRFIEDTLAPERIRRRGIFQPEFVAQALEDHFSGRANHVALIWTLLSFETWCRKFRMFGGA